MTFETLGPLMFVVLFLLIFVGYPVAFSLGGTALAFAVIGVAGGEFEWDLIRAFPERVFGIMDNQILLAVPFFIFMGTMLQRSRLAEDLLRTIGLLFGPVRGGLALAVVFVGALLAAWGFPPHARALEAAQRCNAASPLAARGRKRHARKNPSRLFRLSHNYCSL